MRLEVSSAIRTSLRPLRWVGELADVINCASVFERFAGGEATKQLVHYDSRSAIAAGLHGRQARWRWFVQGLRQRRGLEGLSARLQASVHIGNQSPDDAGRNRWRL